MSIASSKAGPGSGTAAATRRNSAAAAWSFGTGSCASRSARLARSLEIEADLLARRARAQREAWLGEVEGIDLTLTFLKQKREETKRLARVAPVELGMPVLAAPR
jgi:hypothetical protein